MSNSVLFQPPAEQQLEFKSYYNNYSAQPQYTQNMSYQSDGITWSSIKSAFSASHFDDDQPLLIELGINFSHIKEKAISVLVPFTKSNSEALNDDDLAGPLVFILGFGLCLALSGKLHFGYVYGLAVLGTISMYTILNLMSASGIDIYRTASVLGYCLLPLVLLSFVSFFLHWTYYPLINARGFAMTMLTSGISVLWCTHAASLMFVTILEMKEQQFLVAYPVGLLYAAFAMVAVF